MTPNWNTVAEFEKQIAEFFGAPYAVAVDSCTHGIELCLRFKQVKTITVPKRTYLSVAMLAEKLGIDRIWTDWHWEDYYWIAPRIADAAVMWKANTYVRGTLMVISFQYQKHLMLGRAGMVLCDDKETAEELKKMSYDGRLPGIPWREQDIKTIGYHYYMTPETAQLGLKLLPEAIKTPPRKWTINDWPDLTKMTIFK